MCEGERINKNVEKAVKAAAEGAAIRANRRRERLEIAKAAMQGFIIRNDGDDWQAMAIDAIDAADALLVEADKEPSAQLHHCAAPYCSWMATENRNGIWYCKQHAAEVDKGIT